jgi:Killing trait
MPQNDDQIIDPILSINEIVLGSSAAKSMSAMYLNLAQSAGMATQNAVSNQQHLNIIGMAAAAASASGILRVGMADQVERLTLDQRIDYLKDLLNLTSSKSTSIEVNQDNDNVENSAPTKDSKDPRK